MATPIPTSCVAVNNSLVEESGRIGPELYRRAVAKRPIIGLQSKTRGAWHDSMGTIVATTTFERSFTASSGDTWANVGASNGSATSCLPAVENVSFGQTTRTYQLRQKAIESPDFCIMDIRQDWQYEQLLGNIVRVLAEISAWEWANHYTNNYFANAGHIITLNATVGAQDSTNGVIGGTYNTSNLATGQLSQGYLDNVYMALMREGTEMPYAFDSATDAPVFPLICSQEMAVNLIRNNPQIRQDIRFAEMGEGTDTAMLTRSLGALRRSYGGFAYHIDPYPRRFTFGGGAYLQIEPFISSGTTFGNKWEVNPAYAVAPFEEVIVFSSDCYQSMVPKPISSPSPGWKFNPTNYMGDFRWVNEWNRTCNPDFTIGYWRAIFADAARPINPQVGYCILAARCGVYADINSCYQS